eukprot:g2764.t1
MYGLHISSFHNEEREVLRNRGEDTRQRIREAEKRNAVEREKKEKQGYHRHSHQVGKLMAEENEARLAQMSKDANDRHQLAKESIERDKKQNETKLEAMKVNAKKLDSGKGALHAISTAVAGWINTRVITNWRTMRFQEDIITKRDTVKSLVSRVISVALLIKLLR